MHAKLLITLALVAGSALAQDPDQKGPRQHGPRNAEMNPVQAGMMMLAEDIVMASYDANKDGTLDETELAKLREDIKAKHEAKRAEILKKYDKDGDGKLSPDERKLMQEDWAKENPEAAQRMDQRREGRPNANNDRPQRERKPGEEGRPNRRGPRGEHGAKGDQGEQAQNGGPKNRPERPQNMRRIQRPMMTGGMMLLMEQYDADGDGILNEQEKKALDAAAIKKFEEKKAIKDTLKTPPAPPAPAPEPQTDSNKEAPATNE